MNGDAAAGQGVPVHLAPLRFGARQGLANEIEQAALADDVPEFAADRSLRGKASHGEIEELAGPVVGEQDALFGIEGDHAFDHAAENGAELLLLLFELGNLAGEAVAHAVEGAGESADLGIAAGARENLLTEAAIGDFLGGPRHLLDGPGQPSRQEGGQQQGGKGGDGGRGGNHLGRAASWA